MIRKETGRFPSFDDTEIYFESRGSGQPLVLVYGLACLMNHWHFQIEELSKKFRVITFDLRGHHGSQVPNNLSTLKIQDLAKDVIALVEHLKIPHAHFIGHSYGVPILLEMALQKPSLGSSLTLVNGFCRNPLLSGIGQEVISPAVHWLREKYQQNPDLWQKMWSTFVNNPLSAPLSALAGGFNWKLTQLHDIQIYLKGVAQIPLAVFIPLFEDLLDFNLLEQLGNIQIPTLVVAGEQDLITPISFQKEMASQLVHSQLSVVPYGSHCTQLDFPEYLNLLIENWITSKGHPAKT